MTPPKFVQITSDHKLGLCGLAEDGTVWRWVAETYSNGLLRSPRWERLA